MAAKIGILGETASHAEATVTLYTVPADKAARVRILFMQEMGSGQGRVEMLIGTPGTERTWNLHSTTTGLFGFSGAKWTNSSLDAPLSEEGVFQEISHNMDASVDNIGYVTYPLPRDYFLSTGDTVKVIFSANADDALVQVQGVEDDA